MLSWLVCSGTYVELFEMLSGTADINGGGADPCCVLNICLTMIRDNIRGFYHIFFCLTARLLIVIRKKKGQLTLPKMQRSVLKKSKRRLFTSEQKGAKQPTVTASLKG
jgi:hypothetical protein